jgi:hypothetical protein
MSLISLFRIAVFHLEITACIAGFISIKGEKNSFWKWLPFYLLIIVTGEALGYYLAFVPSLNKYNPILFNFILLPFQIIFFHWLLYKNILLYNKVKANWVIYGMLLYCMCLIIDWFFIPETSLWVSTFSFSVGMLLLLLAVLLFFYYYINSNDIIFFKRDRIFWICLGLFIYYIATLPFEGLRNTLLKQPRLFMLYWYIDMGLACIMYISFIISFIWAKPR